MMLHLWDFGENALKSWLEFFAWMRLRRMLSFMASVEAQTQMLFLSGSSVVMAKSLCRIKESGKALQQLFTIQHLTLMLKRTGSIRRTCFQTCCFFCFFSKRPRAEIITCRLNPCLFKLGNQERTERVTFFPLVLSGTIDLLWVKRTSNCNVSTWDV